MSNWAIKCIKNPFVWNFLLMIVVGCALIYGTLAWLDHYTRHNEAVIVPDVKGLSMNEAKSFFDNTGLRYNVIDSVFSNDVNPGAIVEVVPEPGSKVKEGRIVFVTINALTAQMAIIPEVADLSFRQAYALLRSLGFKNIEVKFVPGDYKDLAVGVERNAQMINRGERVPLVSTLTLIISNGEKEIDSLSLDSLNVMPVESLNSDLEEWF